MQIQINAGDVDLSPAIEEHVNVELSDSLRRFSDQITRVEVHLRDLNGPKHGLDKRCTLEIRLAGHDPLAVEHDAENLYDAVKEAAGKAERLVQRYLERHEEHLSGR